MPFRKASKVKTMNNAFLKNIFSSKKFVDDYVKFIGYKKYIFFITKKNIMKILPCNQIQKN